MADFPQSLRAIVREAATRSNCDGIEAATDFAYRKWKKCDEYAEFVEAMVRGELRSLICDVRHQDNVNRRKVAGEYGGPAKVSLGSEANRAARESLLDYSINGRRLGSLFGKELDGLASAEEARGNGCYLNARFLRAIKPLVPAESRVEEKLSETKAKKLFREVSNTSGRARRAIGQNSSIPDRSTKNANGAAKDPTKKKAVFQPVGAN